MLSLVKRWGADGVLLWSRETLCLDEAWGWFYAQAEIVGTAGGGRVELFRDGVVVDQVCTRESDPDAAQLRLVLFEREWEGPTVTEKVLGELYRDVLLGRESA